MQDLAFAGDRRDYEGEIQATRAGLICLPTAAVSNFVPNERHCVIQEARPDKIAFFIFLNRLIVVVQYFEKAKFGYQMHLAMSTLLNRTAVFGHAVAVEDFRPKSRLNLFSKPRIKGLAASEANAHWNRDAAGQDKIREDAENRREPLKNRSLSRPQKFKIVRCRMLRQVKNTHQSLAFGKIG